MSTLIQATPYVQPMCNHIGARLVMHQTLTLEKLYHHLLSPLGKPRAISYHLKLDLVLWLNHHSYEELPDALEYYQVNPNSDPEDDLTNLDLLDQREVKVTIHTEVTMTSCTLLDWAKCFLATYWEYPGLYDLLDTCRPVFLALKLHLCSSTFPSPLLP